MSGRQRLGAEVDMCGNDIARPGVPAYGNDWRRLRHTVGNTYIYGYVDGVGNTDRHSELHTGNGMADSGTVPDT